MRKMKKWVAILCMVTIAFSLLACSSGETGSGDASSNESSTESNGGSEVSGDEILIGCLQDITGATSSLGKMVELGAQWAIDEINENGGIDGKQIKMITYDTKGDVNEAITAFTRAVTTDNVSVIIGPPVSNIALAVAPISEEYDVPLIGFAIDPQAHVQSDGTPWKNMFAFQPSAIIQGSIVGKYAVEESGYENFGIIYNESNAYSLSFLDPFINAVETSGGNIVETVSFSANDKDFKTILGKLISEDVDAIYAPNYTQELILIVQQARALGFEGALICGLDANPPFNTLLGESADNIYYINNLDNTAPDMVEMIDSIKEKTDVEPTNKFFLGYDTVHALAEIIQEEGTDSVAIRDAITNLDYEGLTGHIIMDKETNMPIGTEMVLFTYDDITPKMLGRFSAE